MITVHRLGSFFSSASSLINVYSVSYTHLPSGAQKALFLSVGTRPFALLQIELAQLGDVLQINVHAPAAFFDALGAGLPAGNLQLHGVKQPGAKILHQCLPRFAVQDGRQHIGVGAVV